MNLSNAGRGYMVQLDGLRAIAVAMVILFHWTPEVKQLALGGLGVQLFFVLSGYLITGILLEARAKAAVLGSSKRQIIKSFYARRLLRIFPLFYLVVLLSAILGAYNVQAYLGWHLSYLSNVIIFLKEDWIGEASHLWSLAVEEQFYLLWPFVILFTPARYLTATVIGFILLAPAFKLTCLYFGVGGSRLGVLPISSFHYLGAGALLAVMEHSNRFRTSIDWRNTFARYVQFSGIAGLVIFAACRGYADVVSQSPFLITVQEFAVISLFCSLTLGAAHGFKGRAGQLLAAKPMVYLGRISYGLYLLHNFVPYFITNLLQHSGLNVNARFGAGGGLLLHTVVLLLVSAFFWHVLESRLNKYKKHFPYVTRAEQPVAKLVNASE